MSEPTTEQIGDAGRQLCSSALLCQQWIDDTIEYLTTSRFENEIEALKCGMTKGREYEAGLAQGVAIADKTMLMQLRDLKRRLRHNEKWMQKWRNKIRMDCV